MSAETLVCVLRRWGWRAGVWLTRIIHCSNPLRIIFTDTSFELFVITKLFLQKRNRNSFLQTQVQKYFLKTQNILDFPWALWKLIWKHKNIFGFSMGSLKHDLKTHIFIDSKWFYILFIRNEFWFYILFIRMISHFIFIDSKWFLMLDMPFESSRIYVCRFMICICLRTLFVACSNLCQTKELAP